MANTTLGAIQQKIRFLTKSPSAALLTDAAINEYINTFVLYDFPEHLRLWDLHTTFSFWCQPYISEYKTDTSLPLTNVLYDFQNLYITVNPPVYIAGYLSGYYQSREQFFRMWPKVVSIQQQGYGTGAQNSYTGFVTNGTGFPPNNNQGAPILQNDVLFDSIDINGMGLQMIDQPIYDATTLLQTNWGRLIPPSNEPPAPLFLNSTGVPPSYMNDPLFPITNYINYITGQFVVTFTSFPGVGQSVNSQVYFFVPSRPLSLLYYDNKFIVRPIPDQPYQIQFEVYKRPTELLATGQSPQMKQWWQYIAYGAARKVLQDRFDYDSVALIEPEYNKQQEMVLRKTVVQNTTQRTATIYSQTSDMGSGWGNWNGFGQSGV